MKTVSSALAALLLDGSFAAGFDVTQESNLYALPDVFDDGDDPGAAVHIPFDLYTITTPRGLQLTYTTAPFPILAPSADLFDAPSAFAAGRVWTGPMMWTPFPFDRRETRSTARWRVGLDADRWQVVATPRLAAPGGDASGSGGDAFGQSNLYALPDAYGGLDAGAGLDRIGAEPWLAAVAAGALDEADVIVARAYLASLPTYPLPPGGVVPVGTIILFRGTVGETEIAGGTATLQLDDYRRALSQQIPRNLYMGGCRHRFGGPRCTVSLAAYTRSGTADQGSTPGSVVASANVAPPGGSGTYTLGQITMTSGRNAGQARLITAWSATRFDLLVPLVYPVAAGDTFTVSAGCDKRLATCDAFANRPNFGGEPFIPVPEISLA